MFLGPNNTKLPVDLVLAMQELGEREICCFGNFWEKSKKIFAARSASVEEMPCFKILSPATSQPEVVVFQQKPNIVQSKPPKLEAFFNAAVDDLDPNVRLQNLVLPRRCEALSMQVWKGYTIKDIDAVYEALVKKGYVRIEGTKLLKALLPTTRL